jgi:VWFA-related protein
VVLVLAGIVAPPTPATAQFRERVDVARLLLDVRATTADGTAIEGLAAADFRVRIDGKPARVESVVWVGADPAGASPSLGDAAGGRPVAPSRTFAMGDDPRRDAGGRLLVLFFQKDIGAMRTRGLMSTLRYVVRFVEGLPAHDHTAVVSFDSRLHVWSDFTPDAAALPRIIERGVLFGEGRARPRPGSPSLLDSGHLTEPRQRAATTAERALLQVAHALAPLPGSKSIVLVGWGLGVYGAGGVRMRPEYGAARAALHAARATVFVLDVTEADYHSLEVGLEQVADDTGGLYLKTHLFPGGAIDRVSRLLAGHYVLIVEEPPGLRSRDERRVDVDLVGRRGTVHARRHYAPRGPSDQP